MKIVLFEDYDYNNFYPLSLTRPIFHLRSGVGTLEDKLKRHFPTSSFSYIIRPGLKEVYKHLDLFDFDKEEDIPEDEDYLFILGSLILDKALDIELNKALSIDNKIVSFRIAASLVPKLSEELFFKEGSLISFLKSANLSFIYSDRGYKQPSYLFELINSNEAELIKDLSYLADTESLISPDSGVIVVGDRKKLFLSPSAKLYPNSCFILDGGPVLVDAGACIMPFSLIEGPCYIGKDSIIDGAKIGSGTSIGNVCKIGGEIGNAIIMDYTNKHHEGFLGNSYIGSFVNLGAMTTTSDLKNNYSSVKIFLKDKLIDTASIKVGSFIGDHSKLGIGSLLNTGTLIGVGSNLYVEGFMYPKYTPSFLWGGKYPFKEYIFERFIKTVKLVLERRSQVLTVDYIRLFKGIFDYERESRKSFL